MSRKVIVQTAVELMERGWLPDAVTRAGIRLLLKNRLHAQTSVADHSEFLETCRRGPIAQVPEKANDQHYEVPAEFFQAVLGPHRKYSCCEWSDQVTTLKEAEEAALALVCQRAQVTDGMRVLDLGCGWGSLTLWLLQQFPTAEVTALSNSQSQRRWIENQARTRGQSDRLTVITADVNEFAPETQFDRVVSIEMFEHVTNHEALLARISDWLRPDGLLFVHLFCHKSMPYFFESRGPSDWMAEHFFTGGMMPSESLLCEYAQHLKVSQQWQVNGTHYQRTCNAWLDNLTAHRQEAMPILQHTYGADQADRWYHRWRIFFMACAELFGFNHGNEWFVAHYVLEPTRKRDRVACEA